MTLATPMANQPVFVDYCLRCGSDILHWYEQVGLNQAVATMANESMVQGPEGDRFVVCPRCGAENVATPLRTGDDYGARAAITALRK